MNTVTFILGPQGSGKTTLALELAKQNPNGYRQVVESDVYNKRYAVDLPFYYGETIVIDGAHLLNDIMFLFLIEQRRVHGVTCNRPPIIVVSNSIQADDIPREKHFNIITLPAR